VGFSIAVVPVWRLVKDWFSGRFFPVDVVNCFIGFVAPDFRIATGRRLKRENHAQAVDRT
jgi:hypothetical protein